MWFKKEYTQSEWMKGLLRAEYIYKYAAYSSKEIFVEDVDGMQAYDILYRNKPDEKPWIIEGNVSLEFGKGMLDYIQYKRDVLEKLK